jgi:membrane associated rhomboid family serine protease
MDPQGAQPPPEAQPPAREGPTLLERLRGAPVTAALFAINTVVFLVAESKGSTTSHETLLRFGAVEPAHVWAGEYWRLGTYMFLHIGWIHFLWNTAMGFAMCTTMERVLGKWRFLLLYLASGLAGGAATTLVQAPVISAGASGALFGVIGATLAIRRRQLPSWSAAWRDPPTRSTLVNIAIWTVIGMTAMSFNNKAHFGGLVVGAAMAWIFTSRRPLPLWAAFGVVYGAVLLFACKPWMRGVAQGALSRTYEAGGTSPPLADYDEANPLFRRCTAGDMVACHTLALREREPDVALLHTVCGAGDEDACAAEGWATAHGRGVPPDADKGAALLASACDAGSAWGCRLASGAPLDDR